MPKLGPIKRKDFVKYLRQVGFSGPFSGGKHEFMTNGSLRLRIPNKHRSDISKNLLLELLNQAGIKHDVWESL